MADTINYAARFEAIGDLYYRATGYLRPGKAEPPETGRESNSDENRGRFEQWLATRGFSDAIDRIVELEAKVQQMEAWAESAKQAWDSGAEAAIDELTHEDDGIVPSQIAGIYALNPHQKDADLRVSP